MQQVERALPDKPRGLSILERPGLYRLIMIYGLHASMLIEFARVNEAFSLDESQIPGVSGDKLTAGVWLMGFDSVGPK